VPMHNELPAFFKDRLNKFCQLAICLVFDALLVIVWYVIDWAAARTSESLASHEFCVGVCKWLTSIAVLVLVLIFLSQDIVLTAWRAWRETQLVIASPRSAEGQ
jgi:hypothetical protein